MCLVVSVSSWLLGFLRRIILSFSLYSSSILHTKMRILTCSCLYCLEAFSLRRLLTLVAITKIDMSSRKASLVVAKQTGTNTIGTAPTNRPHIAASGKPNGAQRAPGDFCGTGLARAIEVLRTASRLERKRQGIECHRGLRTCQHVGCGRSRKYG